MSENKQKNKKSIKVQIQLACYNVRGKMSDYIFC